MNPTNTDASFVQDILPTHYLVTAGERFIRCKSPIGIRLSPFINQSSGNMVTDAEDDEHWGYVFGAIKQRFGARFQCVEHSTCFCHVDFTIYLKPQQ